MCVSAYKCVYQKRKRLATQRNMNVRLVQENKLVGYISCLRNVLYNARITFSTVCEHQAVGHCIKKEVDIGVSA